MGLGEIFVGSRSYKERIHGIMNLRRLRVGRIVVAGLTVGSLLGVSAGLIDHSRKGTEPQSANSHGEVTERPGDNPILAFLDALAERAGLGDDPEPLTIPPDILTPAVTLSPVSPTAEPQPTAGATTEPPPVQPTTELDPTLQPEIQPQPARIEINHPMDSISPEIRAEIQERFGITLLTSETVLDYLRHCGFCDFVIDENGMSVPIIEGYDDDGNPIISDAARLALGDVAGYTPSNRGLRIYFNGTDTSNPVIRLNTRFPEETSFSPISPGNPYYIKDPYALEGYGQKDTEAEVYGVFTTPNGLPLTNIFFVNNDHRKRHAIKIAMQQVGQTVRTLFPNGQPISEFGAILDTDGDYLGKDLLIGEPYEIFLEELLIVLNGGNSRMRRPDDPAQNLLPLGAESRGQHPPFPLFLGP